MKSLISAFLALTISVILRADDEAILAQVKAADDLRVSAMIAGDSARLDEVLSDGLHYAHSVKLIESKAEHIASLASRHLIYQKIDFRRREFSVIAPGAVACYGRALVDVGTERMIFRVDINFLAVWRLENQRWRLFAWQSSRNDEIVPLGPPSEKQPNSESPVSQGP